MNWRNSKILKIEMKGLLGWILFLCTIILSATISSSFLASSFGFAARLRMNGSVVTMRERKCDLAGTRQNSKCNSVSHSGVRTHRVQYPNLQHRRLWWEEGNKFVRLRITTRTLKTIEKFGLDRTARKYGVDLNKFSLSSGTGPVRPRPIIL